MISLQDIQQDNRSGASELLDKAAEFLKEQIDSVDSQRQLQKTCIDLVRAQPRMAPMIHLADTVMQGLSGDSGLNPCAVVQVIDIFLEKRRQSQNRIKEHLRQLIPDGACVGIYSRSSLVIKSLQHCAKHTRFSVCLCESRPMLEGQTAALELLESGIAVTFRVDAGMSALVNQADLLLVGADTVQPSAVTNKIGSRVLALTAHADGKPLYCAASFDKFLPDDLRQPPEPEHDASQIWDTELEIEFDTRYFEEFHPHLLKGLITEQGILSPESIHDWIPAIHPQLRQALTGPAGYQ